MLLVVDANVVISSLIAKGKPFRVFSSNAILKAFEFISPEFSFSEVERNITKITLLTKLSQQEVSETLSAIKEQISFISMSCFEEYLPEARRLNPKDAPYLALAIARNCGIFSGDKQLGKQARVNVYSPKELLDMLGIA